jgi:hypothetical protein
VRGAKIMQTIKKGTKVECIPNKKARVFGFEDDRRLVTGTVTYVNEPNEWFLVEYEANGNKLHVGFKFWDIGHSVRVCGDKTELVPEETTDEGKKPYVIRASHMDKQKTIADYLAAKLEVMRDLGVTPTAKEWDRISSLDSEIKIDAAVRAVMKKRWAERSYK